MSLLANLTDRDAEVVAAVVRKWCERNHVSPECDQGRVAMSIAVDRALSGENDPAALLEAVSTQMRLEQYKHPL